MAAIIGTMTELIAVNMMLRYIGEQPVNAISTTVSESFIAQQLLQEVSRKVQSVGLRSNTEIDVELLPNGSDEIDIPANTLKIDAMDKYRKIVARGTRLFDVETNSFTFTGPLRVERVTLLEFGDLPEPIKEYITIRASRMLIIQLIGDTELYRNTEKDELEARQSLAEHETDVGDYSIFDSISVGAVANRQTNYPLTWAIK